MVSEGGGGGQEASSPQSLLEVLGLLGQVVMKVLIATQVAPAPNLQPLTPAGQGCAEVVEGHMPKEGVVD